MTTYGCCPDGARILEVRCFYYHLKEACQVDAARLRRVDAALRRMRHLTFDLQEQLKYCSPLGPLLRDLRQAAKPTGAATAGIATIRRLEGAGIRDLAAVASCTLADLRDLGVRQPWASQILALCPQAAAIARLSQETDFSVKSCPARRRISHQYSVGGSGNRICLSS